MISVTFSHLDYNVSDLERAVRFYNPLMAFLGFTKEIEEEGWVLYGNGNMKLCIVQCGPGFAEGGFHRKRPGLNHIAFQAGSREAVDRAADFLRKRKISLLYGSPGQFHGSIEYYAVFFEDPFRLKLEVVYSPEYQGGIRRREEDSNTK
ncbi:glyoxalase/bleomycin resistance protein/dioxygenase superfamily protein [Melghirimyces profundicolus]|uniref:Glyoxalase/bleomycin resistance protein/dioxygenase superfamily protein n=1 Tax=Melghirimyces profundicolus TaxID=1242148 RepID=A0A2T6C7D6_9BACL|nr:VOC family protein [Melghirimyces profundicolus]PTX64239.1 glyoxalase/bleomycin resistance protein/dioxygenase superfamily protein [Melghirimyces profundicolus]